MASWRRAVTLMGGMAAPTAAGCGDLHQPDPRGSLTILQV
jgi:hypothetical protein